MLSAENVFDSSEMSLHYTNDFHSIIPLNLSGSGCYNFCSDIFIPVIFCQNYVAGKSKVYKVGILFHPDLWRWVTCKNYEVNCKVR